MTLCPMRSNNTNLSKWNISRERKCLWMHCPDTQYRQYPPPNQIQSKDGELRKLQDRDPLLGPAIRVHLKKVPSPIPSAIANIVANSVLHHNVLCHETPHSPAAQLKTSVLFLD